MPNVYEVITSRIIKQLESGTAPWHKPWKASGKNGLPRNLVSGREYRGINVWILSSSGYSSPSWLTFRQARELDGHVRQGEVGVPVVYWKFGKREVQDGDEIIEKASVLCRYYTLFNQEQCEGLKIKESEPAEEQPQVEPIEACVHVVNAGWVSPQSGTAGTTLAIARFWILYRCRREPASTAERNITQRCSTSSHTAPAIRPG